MLISLKTINVSFNKKQRLNISLCFTLFIIDLVGLLLISFVRNKHWGRAFSYSAYLRDTAQ